MDIRYISKIDGDNVTLTSPTSAIAGEKEIIVNIAELNELRKSINIYGFNAITGSIKTLTIEEVEKTYQSKLRLVGKEYTPKTKARVVNCKKGKSIVGLTFDVGMYEVLGAVMPFSTFVKDYQAPCSVIIKSIEFSDKFDLRYTKEVRDLFYPLSVLYNSSKIRIYSDVTIDLSKYTLERMESMESMFANLPINVKMPEVQTNKQTIFKNIVNRTRCMSGETLYNYTAFAIENTKEGMFGIADDRIIVDSAKLSELADINNLFKTKDCVKSDYDTIVIIEELVLDCEITEGMFEDIRTMYFVIRNINVTPEFSIQGYSTQVALNLINNFDDFKFSISTETKKYTAYKMNMSSQDCRTFLRKSIEEGLIPQGILDNFRDNLFSPQNTTGDGEIGFITMVNGASDVCLPIVFMSLIFQGGSWSEVEGFRGSLHFLPYYTIILSKPTN